MEKHALGAIPSPVDVRTYKAVCTAADVEFPEEFSLYRPPVKNQGSVGSCVAHALSSLVEYFNYVQEGITQRMSTDYIYGNRNGSLHTGYGMITSNALNNLRKYGDCAESIYSGNTEVPDVITKFKEKGSAVPSSDTFYNRITSYFRLDSTKEIKANLMENGIVIIAVAWYNNTKCEHGILEFNEDSGYAGGHCMFIYGWNKDGWLVGNSWGKNWGNNGNCIIRFTHKISEAYGVTDQIVSNDSKDKLIAELREKILEQQNQALLNQEKIDECINTIYEQSKKIEEITNKLNLTEVSNEDLKESLEELNSQLNDARKAIKEAHDESVEYRFMKEKCEAEIVKYKEQIEQLEKKLLEYQKPFNSKVGQAIAKILNAIFNFFKKGQK